MTEAATSPAMGAVHPFPARPGRAGANGPGVAVRAATCADLPGCAAVMNGYIDATDWLPRTVSAQAIRDMFAPALLDSRKLFVAVTGDTVLGYASFDASEAFLPALYLSPEARGRGIGTQLLDQIKQTAPDGFGLTVWQANPAARRFYEREGLAHTGEGVDGDGLPVWQMRWPGIDRSRLQFRPANFEDLSHCASIFNDFVDETPWLPRLMTREDVAEIFVDPELLSRKRIFVAERGGVVRGFVSLETRSGLISAIYVMVDERGQGTGKALLDVAKRALPGGIVLTCWQDATDALRFFEREGLERSASMIDDWGFRRWTMRWKGKA